MQRPSDLDAQLLHGTPYEAYVYAYPHKTAYRAIDPPIPLEEAWAGEAQSALYLYVHVPFCEMRCGFCNLFTMVNPGESLVDAYLAALERQIAVVRRALPDARFARFAIGGGTPTLLPTDALRRVLDLVEERLDADLRGLPSSVETSPATATPESIRLLVARGVDRISLGVQSFIPGEAQSVGRPQRPEEVERALGIIRDAGAPTLNIDLIYGLPEQTPESWRRSLEAALAWRPEEIYLYPLYVRPLTGLDRRGRALAAEADAHRVALYRQATSLLGERGYTQASMRMFRAAHARDAEGPVYCVQDDGMVGLGAGARSYTRALHWATEFAVGARSVREIIATWCARTDAQHGLVDWGFRLDGDEQRRRWVALTLFGDGLDLQAYRRRFGSDALVDLPALARLEPLALAVRRDGKLVLTARGLERSDAIGPALFSDAVRARMAAWELR
jgi:oxygen-independent coproporphyrinogen-3 oxidase